MRIYRETSIDSGASIVIVRYVFLGYLDMHYLSMKGCVDEDESAGDQFVLPYTSNVGGSWPDIKLM